MLAVDDIGATEKSRLLTLRIANLTLRLMETWRQPFNDIDSVMIITAMAAISGEKLTRTRLEKEFHDIAKPIPQDWLTSCNLNSIAAATGLNRETARRKVNKLVAAGLVVRAGDGSLHLAPGFSQRQEPLAIVRAQLEAIVRTANELLRDGVLQSTGDDPRRRKPSLRDRLIKDGDATDGPVDPFQPNQAGVSRQDEGTSS